MLPATPTTSASLWPSQVRLQIMFELSMATAAACAVMAGVFFAFSAFIMTALGNIPPSEGIRAMQRINIDVFCWPFFFLFFGLPLVSLGLGIYAIVQWSLPESIYYLAASTVYICGSFLVTVICNIPLNDALARVDANTESAVEAWQNYLIYWTKWNHVRAFASLAACPLFAWTAFT